MHTEVWSDRVLTWHIPLCNVKLEFVFRPILVCIAVVYVFSQRGDSRLAHLSCMASSAIAMDMGVEVEAAPLAIVHTVQEWCPTNALWQRQRSSSVCRVEVDSVTHSRVAL